MEDADEAFAFDTNSRNTLLQGFANEKRTPVSTAAWG
jgi:hypothetical protein